MRRTYKSRLYPNREQSEVLERMLETHRRLYNDALAERKEAYQTEQRTVHYAEEAGVRVVAVNPRNTTQRCSRCGCLPLVPLALSDREYHCAACGQVCDRDLNAARNVWYLAWTEPLGANQEGCLMDCPRSLRLEARESSLCFLPFRRCALG